MSQPKFYELDGVQVFDVGTWNGVKYSDADLDEMVANFAELSAAGYDIPAKLGHGKQDLIDREDLPAAAYVKRLYRKGTKLVADFTRVPQKVKDVIDLGAYRTVSAEIYNKVQLLGKTFENVVSAVAFLGGDIPAVGTLDDVIELYNRAGVKPRPLVFTALPGATRHVVTWTPQKEDNMADKPSQSVDDEVTELDSELTKLAQRASDATKGKAGAPAFRAFLHETLTKLRGLAKKNKSKNAAASTDSYQDRIAELSDAVREKFGGPDGYDAWLVDNGDDWLVLHWNGADWQCSYVDDDATGVITIGDPVEVERGPWQRINTAALNKAGTTGGKGTDMAITKNLATALGIPETADEPTVLKALEDLKAKASTDSAKFTALQEEVAKLRAESAARDASSAVDAAIAAHKLLPAKKDWALKFAARDLEGFKSTFGADAPEVVDTTEKGSATDAGEPKSEVATFRAKVAEKVKADTREIDYGQKVTDAQRAVSVEEPELYAAIRTRR